MTLNVPTCKTTLVSDNTAPAKNHLVNMEYSRASGDFLFSSLAMSAFLRCFALRFWNSLALRCNVGSIEVDLRYVARESHIGQVENDH